MGTIFVLTLPPTTYNYDREFLYVGPDKSKVVEMIEAFKLTSWEVFMWENGEQVHNIAYDLEALKNY